MRISESPRGSLDWTRREPASSAPEPTPPRLPAVIEVPQRNCVSFEPTQRARAPLAALIAQLVANAENLPAARLRRRADPAESAGAYRAVARLAPEAGRSPGRVI